MPVYRVVTRTVSETELLVEAANMGEAGVKATNAVRTKRAQDSGLRFDTMEVKYLGDEVPLGEAATALIHGNIIR